MIYNSFLKSTVAVSAVGFGAWQLGKSRDWESMSNKEAIHLVEKALELGINFFDTAPNYGNGTSEERLGLVLSNVDRSKIVINTKFGHSVDGETNFGSSEIRKSLEGSLKRLKTDYVDSLIIHNPPFEYLDGNRNDHYEILERLIEEGKILAYGASLDTSEEINTFLSTTNAKVIEAFFNILHQDSRNAFPLAEKKDASIIVKIPLDSGWLSGKYNENSNFDDIRSRWSRKDIETRAMLVKDLKNTIGDEDLVQTAIAFCLSYDVVKTVIPGNKNINQLLSNIEAGKNILKEDQIYKLEKFYEEKVKNLNLPW